MRLFKENQNRKKKTPAVGIATGLMSNSVQKLRQLSLFAFLQITLSMEQKDP